MQTELRDRVHGCLLGGAIGDSLGAIVEGWSYQRIRETYGRVDELEAYDITFLGGHPGSVTDDSTMRQYISLAIARRGGRVTPDEVASVLRDVLNPDRVWVTEEITYNKLFTGLDPWESGRNNVPTATATMSIAPIGIINAADPRQAYQDGYNVASITQDGIERSAAATVAAGIASAFRPDATAEQVVDVMLEHSSDIVFRAIDLSLQLVTNSESVDEFVEGFYEERLDWQFPAVEWDRNRYHQGEVFSGSSLEIVPAVAGLLLLCGDDPNRLIVEGASFGRDADTIGTICGNFGGALAGADALDDDWTRTVEEANRDLFEEIEGTPDADFASMADRLVEALGEEQRRASDRAKTLQNLL